MDPSITSEQLGVLLGEDCASIDHLTPYQILAVVSRVLDIIKPKLKYVSGFSELRNGVRRFQPDSSFHYYFEGVMKWNASTSFSHELTAKVRCMMISHSTEKFSMRGVNIPYESVLLTQDGELLMWKFQKQVAFGKQPPSEIKRISVAELLEFVKEKHSAAPKSLVWGASELIRTLRYLCFENQETKQKVATEARDLFLKIVGLTQLIRPFGER